MSYTTLMIDADSFAYTACQSSEIEIEHGDWHQVSCNFPQAKARFLDTLKRLEVDLKCSKMEVFFTGRTNFRKELIDPTYKGARQKRKPLGFYKLVQWCKDNLTFHLEEGLEADDLLGLRCHLQRDVLLVSGDKDQLTIACQNYNHLKKEFTDVSLEAADRFFFTQILTGDPVDGFKGCPGIGAVKAKALLDKTPQGLWWEAVVDTFVKAGLTEADALTNARLARILRTGEYDWKTRTPTLWTPPA